MAKFELFDYEGQDWLNLKSTLQEPFASLDDFFKYLRSNTVASEYPTVEALYPKYPAERLLSIVNYIRLMALHLDQEFPTGDIQRLSPTNEVLTFTRRQVLVLLCHMLLCTLRKSPQNSYWVTFENWLTDGRSCAVAYLECLLGYFEQALEYEKDANWTSFWKEAVTFQRVKIDVAEVLNRIETATEESIRFPIVCNQGKIGDTSVVELDFANKDIGFGTYGTQEEVLFGSSPELCIAMLFTDSMLDVECIVIKGARKVGQFEGYGSSLKFERFLPFDDVFRNERTLIAADATDYSEFEEPISPQFSREHLQREICKLFCAFSAIPSDSTVDTGKWGCGAFCGHKQLKAVLQIVASTVSAVNIVFYTFGDESLGTELDIFKEANKSTSVNTIWEFLLHNKCESEADDLLIHIQKLRLTKSEDNKIRDNS